MNRSYRGERIEIDGLSTTIKSLQSIIRDPMPGAGMLGLWSLFVIIETSPSSGLLTRLKSALFATSVVMVTFPHEDGRRTGRAYVTGLVLNHLTQLPTGMPNDIAVHLRGTGELK